MVLMQKMALSLLWQDGDEKILERARGWSELVPRVYVVDLRTQGEAYATLAEARLHYAPFRQKTTLGCALNRSLRLAYEEGIAWLWILDGATDISREELLIWSQKAIPSTALYRSEAITGAQRLFRRTPCGLLVSVAMARSLGGWNPVLPAQLVFADFEQRLLAQGGTVEKGIKFEDIRSDVGFAGLWTQIWRRFFTAGRKSR
jgi:hypothetical protein